MPCIELSYYMTCKNMIAMVCLYFNAIKGTFLSQNVSI